jgi:hypothetical protein
MTQLITQKYQSVSGYFIEFISVFQGPVVIIFKGETSSKQGHSRGKFFCNGLDNGTDGICIRCPV